MVDGKEKIVVTVGVEIRTQSHFQCLQLKTCQEQSSPISAKWLFSLHNQSATEHSADNSHNQHPHHEHNLQPRHVQHKQTFSLTSRTSASIHQT